VHDPEVLVAVKGHVTGLPDPGVAVMVTVAPTSNPDPIFIVGVSSAVLLSVELLPRSEAVARSGVPGAPNGVTLTELEATESPALFTAFIVTEYVVPFVKPEIVKGDVVDDGLSAVYVLPLVEYL
jgi:hypothetical protein